jgi:glycosyltransferase involved in cell wall biosynthesis
MKRLGIFLGFPPHGGGAFQYAHSVLLAAVSLPADAFEVVAVQAHPAWSAYVDALATRVESVPAKSGAIDAIASAALRSGFPVALWRKLAPRFHPLASTLLALDCDFWLFPAQEYLTYALPTPTIGVIHDLMHRHERSFPEVSSFGLYRRRERHYRNLCDYASAVLVDSTVGFQHVLDAYAPDPSRIHVLPFAAREADEIGTADAAPLSLPPRYLFYPAQFWKHKNHVRLLHAFAQARASLPDLHLVLAGAPKNGYGEVRSTIAELGLESQVRLLGYVPDAAIAGLYTRAVALVMPTFFGPTNLPPLEAMAVGCPVIVSGIYGMPEQLGDAAEYVDPNSVESIATAIVNVASHESRRRELIEAGYRRIGELSQSRFNERFAAIIDTIFAQ